MQWLALFISGSLQNRILYSEAIKTIQEVTIYDTQWSVVYRNSHSNSDFITWTNIERNICNKFSSKTFYFVQPDCASCSTFNKVCYCTTCCQREARIISFVMVTNSRTQQFRIKASFEIDHVHLIPSLNKWRSNIIHLHQRLQ